MNTEQQQRHADPAALSPAQAVQALQLARRAGFGRAAATMHHLHLQQ